MGDVCGGSSSTSMAKEVLKWRTTSPVVATEIWTELAATNESIHSQFQVLNRLYNENKVQYEEHIQWAAGNILLTYLPTYLLTHSLAKVIQSLNGRVKAMKLLLHYVYCANYSIKHVNY